MSENSELLGLVQYYERLLDDMQGHVFYCQDPEGMLRRWTPPRPISRDGKVRSEAAG